MIGNLKELYKALDDLSSYIGPYCKKCERHCCRGYIFLMPDEVEPLLKDGASVLEFSIKENEFGYVLDTYPRDENGDIKFGVFGPICPNRISTTGKCPVYQDRPLVCRLYPIDIQELNEESQPYWVVHKKCDFITKAARVDVERWLSQARDVVRSMSDDLVKSIEAEWRKLSDRYVYPSDFNGYDLYVLGKAFSN